MNIDSIKHCRSLSFFLNATFVSFSIRRIFWNRVFQTVFSTLTNDFNMYLKNSSIYGGLVFFMCFLLIISTEAQLNFSTGWGKRSNNLQSRSGDRSCEQEPNLKRLLNLYNLIQIEAQWILDCQKSSE